MDATEAALRLGERFVVAMERIATSMEERNLIVREDALVHRAHLRASEATEKGKEEGLSKFATVLEQALQSFLPAPQVVFPSPDELAKKGELCTCRTPLRILQQEKLPTECPYHAKHPEISRPPRLKFTHDGICVECDAGPQDKHKEGCVNS